MLSVTSTLIYKASLCNNLCAGAGSLPGRRRGGAAAAPASLSLKATCAYAVITLKVKWTMAAPREYPLHTAGLFSFVLDNRVLNQTKEIAVSFALHLSTSFNLQYITHIILTTVTFPKQSRKEVTVQRATNENMLKRKQTNCHCQIIVISTGGNGIPVCKF